MSGAPQEAPTRWADAALAALLFTLDPLTSGGVALRALPGPVRDRWLTLVREGLPDQMPLRRVPRHVGDDRLLGGLDLAATLAAGRPVADRGLLAEADGGVVVLSMAERLEQATAARITAAHDTGWVVLERDGLALRSPARFGIVALDEGIGPEERLPAALLDRLAFHVDLTDIGLRETAITPPAVDPAAVRDCLAQVSTPDGVIEVLCATAAALGIASVRAPLLAAGVARLAAAVAGRDTVADEDAAIAARLVLAPRATVLPAAAPPEQEEQPVQEPPPPEPDAAQEEARADDAPEDAEGERAGAGEMVLAAAQAAIPPGLLAQLRAGGATRQSARGGRVGASFRSRRRGRPIGSQRGELRSGARLDVVATLRAAAPWQPLRRRDGELSRVAVRQEDFHVRRYKHRTQTTSMFVVDASGSTAMQRLAEAKGAVELLLADCYVRRDRVALIVFRGRDAELVLPPTRSLVRAKRCLAGLPGGGATPLASGIDAAVALAGSVARDGDTPVIILLTDGRGNIARDGNADRARAGEDALAAARAVRAAGLTALLVDTSPRPQRAARQLADEMEARYLPLPYADAATLSQAVRANAPG